jgi:hypothetical protein
MQPELSSDKFLAAYHVHSQEILGISWALTAPFLRKYGTFDADSR